MMAEIFKNEYFWIRMTYAFYYIFACHWVGMTLRIPWMIAKQKLPLLLFIYSIPFGYCFGVNWKLLVIVLTTYACSQFAPKYATASSLIVECLLYVPPILAYYL